MSDERMERKLEAAMNHGIDQALARQPEVVVPEGFAARVRAELPAVCAGRLPAWRRMGAGRLAGAVAMAGLAVAFCWLAPGARPDFGSLRFDLELVVLAEMAAVGWWVGQGSGLRG
jgi:hypothetical protein